MLNSSVVLSDSERELLQKLLKENYADHGFSFLIEDDRHLVFEALHILADGDPNRLFSIMHPADKKNHHPDANQGKTWHFLHKVHAGDIRACASELPAFEENKN